MITYQGLEITKDVLRNFSKETISGRNYERVVRALRESPELQKQLDELEGKPKPLSLLERIVRGGPSHKTRLHDAQGNFLPLVSVPSLIKGLTTSLLVAAGRPRPEIPWLGYRSLKRLDAILDKKSVMIEFGSGLSTVWFARRAAKVIAIEHHKDWLKTVQSQIDSMGITHIDLRLHEGMDTEYSTVPDVADDSIDFCLVDGIFRLDCCKEALGKVKPGGFIYLDNSDVNGDPERVEACRLLCEASEKAGHKPEYFVDVAPCQFAVNQGLLVKNGK